MHRVGLGTFSNHCIINLMYKGGKIIMQNHHALIQLRLASILTICSYGRFLITSNLLQANIMFQYRMYAVNLEDALELHLIENSSPFVNCKVTHNSSNTCSNIAASSIL